MKGVDISKACDYDEIGNKSIEICIEGFHVYFTHFINFSLSLGQYPSGWKFANVIPLFKNDNFNSKRITVLSLSCQVFPRSVKELFSFICITFLMETL